MKHALRKTAYLPNQACYPHPSDLRRKLPFIPIRFGLPVDHYVLVRSMPYLVFASRTAIAVFWTFGSPNPYNQIAAFV